MTDAYGARTPLKSIWVDRQPFWIRDFYPGNDSMGRRCGNERKLGNSRLLFHAFRLRANVDVSSLFDRLQAVCRRQHIPTLREAKVEQLRVHDPSTGCLRSRCHHQYCAAKDIQSSPEGELVRFVGIALGIFDFGLSNADVCIVHL